MWNGGDRLTIKRGSGSQHELPTHSSDGGYRSSSGCGSADSSGPMGAPLLHRPPHRRAGGGTMAWHTQRLLQQLLPSIVVLMFVVPAVMFYKTRGCLHAATRVDAAPALQQQRQPTHQLPDFGARAPLLAGRAGDFLDESFAETTAKLAAEAAAAENGRATAAQMRAREAADAAAVQAAAEAEVAVPAPPRRPRKRMYVDPETYLIDPEPKDMRAQHKLVKEFIASPQFRAQQEERKTWPKRGIVINAGGRIFLTSTIVQLKVLRDVLKCTLPVELVWHGPSEMDNATMASLAKHFGPLTGYDITTAPYPKHHKRTGVKLNRFEGKVMSVLLAHFQEVMLLDADNVPLINPEVLFDDPDYKLYGNLFWPDYWSVAKNKDILYDMVGLEFKPAKAALDEGRGSLIRDTESGQLLLNLNEHADVAEYLFWINTFSEQVYRAVWGDKDTFAMAFGVAGKAHMFMQNEVPPGVLFNWKKDMLMVKATRKREYGWMLIGMLQFDPSGRAAFMHRTIDKFRWDGQPTHIGLITGPLPYRWVHYYIHQEALGPTVGVPYDYVAPDSAFAKWTLNPMMTHADVAPDGQGWLVKGPLQTCPISTFHDYRAMRQLGLPIGSNATLDAVCAPLLHAHLGAAYEVHKAGGYLDTPELVQVAKGDYDAIAMREHSGMLREVPDGTPVAAWVPDYMAPKLETDTSRAFKGAYDAFEWLKANVNDFPKIRDGP